MIRRTTLTALLTMVPAAALADGGMPQMAFHNPLTYTQVIWMVVIMVVLYLLLAQWGLPQMGAVLENRAGLIAAKLAAAQAAKNQADAAARTMNVTMKQARQAAQSEIVKAVTDAKAKAAADAATLNATLDAKLAESEAQIQAARQQALAAIKPVAADAAAAILHRLTGRAATPEALGVHVDAAMTDRAA
jgi:F-type H+-transporting ATPase subunit b